MKTILHFLVGLLWLLPSAVIAFVFARLIQ